MAKEISELSKLCNETNDNLELCKFKTSLAKPEFISNFKWLCNTSDAHPICNDFEELKTLPNRPVEQIISVYIIPSLCVLGLIFNVVTIGIICKKRLWNSTSLYLTSLGIVDLLGLICICFVSRAMCRLLRLDEVSGQRILNHYVQILIQIIIFSSNWLTVVLAVERYVAICHPVIAKIIYSKTRARIIVVLVCLFSTLIHLPQFFTYSTSSKLRLTSLGESKIYKNFHIWFVQLFLFLVIPTIILAGVNVRLIIEVRRSTEFIRKQSGIYLSVATQRTLSREQTKIATMLIGLIFVFFFFQLPIIVFIILSMLFPSMNPEHLQTLKMVTSLIYVIKSDVNFVFYCWLCDRFLCTVKNLVCMNCVYYLPFLRRKQMMRNPHINMSHTRSSRLSHNGSNSYIRCPAAGRETTTV